MPETKGDKTHRDCRSNRCMEFLYGSHTMFHGTGLSLASVYGIIKNHGGMITVASEVGHGTTTSICRYQIKKHIAAGSH